MSSKKSNSNNLLSASQNRTKRLAGLESPSQMFRLYSSGGGLTKESSKFGGSTTSPKLADALNSVLLSSSNRATHDALEADEKCHIHPKEQHIAVDESNGVFACNKCVFEKKVKKPLFMASFARQTKFNFDEMYQLLLKNINDVEDLSPSVITQKIQTYIQNFFSTIYKQLRDIEKDVTQQIRTSQKLKELASMLENLHDQFDEDLLEKLENEKSILEDKVEHARFGYIVTRKEYYRDVIKEMEELNAKLLEKITGSHAIFGDLLKVEYSHNWLNTRLWDVIEQCVKVDNLNIERHVNTDQTKVTNEIQLFSGKSGGMAMNHNDQSPFKSPEANHTTSRMSFGSEAGNNESNLPGGEIPIQAMDSSFDEDSMLNPNIGEDQPEFDASQPVTDIANNYSGSFGGNEEMKQGGGEINTVSEMDDVNLINEFYTLKNNNTIYKHSLAMDDIQTEKVFSIAKNFSPKVAFTQQKRIFLIGGAKDLKQSDVVNVVLELVPGADGALVQEPRAPMHSARTGFGALVDNYGATIYVAGGNIGNFRPSLKCESYNIQDDVWTEMPPLTEAKFSLSLCMFNDEHIFAFGGIGTSSKVLSTVEKLDLNAEDSKWVKLSITLPSPMASLGCFQVDFNHIVVFGGWNQGNQKTVFTLIQDAPQKFKFLSSADKGLIQDLERPDFFNFNGAFRLDTNKGEVIICGQECLHVFKEATKIFGIVKPISYPA